MLRELVLGHYKPFRDVQHARCAPITLIVGRNSSGKSSVLGAIDLLRRSYASHYGLWLDTVDQPKRLCHRHDTTRGMVLGSTLSNESGTFSVAFSYRVEEETLQARRLTFHGQLAGGEPIEFESTVQASAGEPWFEAEIPLEVAAGLHRREVTRKLKHLKKASESIAKQLGKQPSPRPSDLILSPTPARLTFHPRDEQGSNCTIVWPDDSLPDNLGVTHSDIALRKALRIFSFEEMNEAFNSFAWFRHVATPPLRPHPEELEDETPSPEELSRINDALVRLGIWYQLELHTFPNEKKGHIAERALRIRDIQLRTTMRLVDVGMGISQILGILFAAFRSPQPKMLTVQQPELHLHPHAQGHFADLMIKVIEEEIAGPSQWIVETHSEAMISRIQRRVRDGRLSPDEVSVLYVEATPSGSEIRELRLNEAGDFLDEWPGGFFEESYRDAVGLAIEDPEPPPGLEALGALAEVE